VKRIRVFLPPIISLFLIMGQPALAQNEAGVQLSVYGGATLADIGGDSKVGVALGFTTVPNRKLKPAPFSWRFGLEYNQKRASGQVLDTKFSSGDLLYPGADEVTLHYLQVYLGGQLHWQFGGVEVCPNLGVGPAFLFASTIDLASEPEEGASAGFTSYRNLDFLSMTGVQLNFSDFLLDFQFAYGLLSLNQSGGGGTNALGVPFASAGKHSMTGRIAGGLRF